MKLTIGCTTRPFGNAPVGEICQRIAAAGYSDVALFYDVGINADSSTEQVLAVRQIAQDAGLKPSLLLGRVELHDGPDDALARYRRLIDHAKTLGAPWLLDLGVGEPALYDQYFALMREAAPYAAAAGVQITLKPHGGITLTASDLIAACDRVNHPAFGLCFDPGNIIYYTQGAQRPETVVSQVAPMVTTAIIKDCIVRDGKPDVMITAGEGWVNFEAVLHGLVQGGFRGPLYVECVGGQSPEEIDANVRRTREFVQAIPER